MKKKPLLKSYAGDNLRRIALPLGGIGTGTVSLGGRGNLQDWALMNTPAVGYTPQIMEGMRDVGPFFALYTEAGEEKSVTALEGMIDSELLEESQGCRAANHGLPRFENCRFETAYPIARISLEDRNVPARVTLDAFNPLVPCNSEASGIPAAILTYTVENLSGREMTAAVCGTVINHIGADGREYQCDWADKRLHRGSKDNVNEFRRSKDFCGLSLYSRGVNPQSQAWGTMALTTPQTEDVTARTAWAERSWGGSLLDFWEDFSQGGTLEERQGDAPFNRIGSLAARKKIAPGESETFTFVLTWHFPNRLTWNPQKEENWVGNWYCRQYEDAWDAAAKLYPRRAELESKTDEFLEAFLTSDLPESVMEAALFNISTLRSQTCFRTAEGKLFGWEGIHNFQGSCWGSCTHVWNYEQTTAFLFGDLAMTMREVEFLHALDEQGHMNFRAHLPLEKNKTDRGTAAADGQMGCIMKFYRDWQLSDDEAALKRFWPYVKRALEFCWLPGGWDADEDGVMEGCQHNTMDVEYFGPNPQMESWYLGALRAGEELARAADDGAFAGKCRELYEKGRAWTDGNLFNGEYYEHLIKVPDEIRDGLQAHMGAKDLSDPILQLGAGCLVDQLVGQYMAHVCGLGYILDPDHVKTTLESIMKYNYKTDFHHRFNCMRSYVMNDESALLMATYPRGHRPKEPFPYYTEVMTGFEHTAGAHMLYEGQTESGLKVIRSIRERYDGKKRNPFNEAECGHHYARAMAAWAHVTALTGFRWSAVTGEMSFAAIEGNHFWAAGYSWGTCTLSRNDGKWKAALTVKGGNPKIRRLIIEENGCAITTIETPILT